MDLLVGREKAEALRVYVNMHQNEGDSSLLILAQKGLSLAQNENLLEYQISFERLTGSLLMAGGKIDSGIVWLDKAFISARQHKLEDEIGEIEGVLGSAYYRKGHMEDAIEHWLPTLNYLEKTGKPYSFGVRLTQIGNAYLMLGQTKTGILYNRKALRVDTMLKMEGMMSRIYNSLGYGFDELKDYDSAIYCYQEAYELGKKTNDDYRMGMSRINICAALESQDKVDEARDCLKETIAFLKERKMDDYLIHVYTTLLNLQLNNDENNEAQSTIDSIKHYLTFYPTEHILLQLPKMEYMVFQALGDYKHALERFKKFTELNDSVSAASKLLEIEQLRLAYETEKKDEKLKAAKRENALKDERNKRTRNLWIASSLALILLFGVLILAKNRGLIKKKKELAESKVHHQLDVLKATIDGQEQERKRIAQELHDGIGQQFTAIKLAYDSLAEKVDSKTEKMSALIEHAAQDVRSLSHQMMPKVLQDVGLVAALRDLIESVQSKEGPGVSFTSRNISARLIEQQEINLYRICQELLNNALKHANATEINVMLYRAEGKVILLVNDNGKGVNLAGKEGHGLMNINSRSEAIGAQYFIESAEGEGFTFTLKLIA